MKRFNANTRKTLKKSGWHDGRRCDLNHYLQLVESLTGKYKPSRQMIDFLLEFNGLHLTYSNDQSLFDFRVYKIDFTTDKCNLRNGKIGEDCLLIGSFCNDDFLAVITETAMYAYDYSFNVFKIGEYYDEGIEFICLHGLSPHKYLRNKII